ncbi:hypothetical protein PS1_001745 [Malus domestica]
MLTCAARWTTVTGKVLRVSRSRLCWGPAQRSHCGGGDQRGGDGGRVGKGFFRLDNDVFPGREAGEDAAVGVGRWVLRKQKMVRRIAIQEKMSLVMEHRRRNLGLCGKFSRESFGLYGF